MWGIFKIAESKYVEINKDFCSKIEQENVQDIYVLSFSLILLENCKVLATNTFVKHHKVLPFR